MKENIKIICEVDPVVKLCCVNRDCVNHVEELNVCNLKNVLIGTNHICAGFVEIKKPENETIDNGKQTEKKKE